MAETQDQCRGRQIDALVKRTDQLRDFIYRVCPTISDSLIAVPNCKSVLPECECKTCKCNPCRCSCEPTAVSGIAVDVPSDLTPEEAKDGLIYQLERENAALDRQITTLSELAQCQAADIESLKAQFTALKNQVNAPGSESDPIYIPDPEESGLQLISDISADPPYNWGTGDEKPMFVHYFGEVTSVNEIQPLSTAFENVDGSIVSVTPKWADSIILYEMDISITGSSSSSSTAGVHANFEGYLAGSAVQNAKSAASGIYYSQQVHRAHFQVPSWKAFTDNAREMKLKVKTYNANTKCNIHAVTRFDGVFGLKLVRPVLKITEIRTSS